MHRLGLLNDRSANLANPAGTKLAVEAKNSGNAARIGVNKAVTTAMPNSSAA